MAVTIRQFALALNLLCVAGRTNDLSDTSDIFQANWPVALGNGSGDGQINQVFHDTRIIAAGATDSLDLAGVLSNPFGQTITFTAIKVIAVYNITTTNSIISVAAAGSTVFAAVHTALIAPGSAYLWSSRVAGEGVVAATGDVLTVINADGSNAATYRIFIAGVE